MNRLASGSPSELPCVWVLAGVLNHRPCDRGYECEECELYQALRGQVSGTELPDLLPLRGHGATDSRPSEGTDPTEEAVSAYLVHLTEDCSLHLDRPYTPGHFWIQETASQDLLIGLDCQNLRILSPVEDLILPRPGVWLKRGETMGWILRGHLAVPLRTPVSGEVMEINHSLLDELKKWGFPRTHARWLIRLHPHECVDQIPGLLRGEAMLLWYQGKLGLLREYIQEAMSPGSEAGRTLNDGGAPNRNLEEVLGAGAFQELVNHLFRELG